MRTNEERVERIKEKAIYKKQHRQKLIKLTAILSGVAAIIIAINLVLFVPYTIGKYDISAYRGSEYYNLMDNIGKLSFTETKTNNFKEWGLDWPFRGFGKATSEAPESDGNDYTTAGTDADTYEEVTNNQVKGIIESDLFKKSSNYIFYIVGDGYPFFELDIYKDSDLSLISQLAISPSHRDFAVNDCELYLSEDCKTVTLVMEETFLNRDKRYNYYTTVVNIDVSDPDLPKETSRKSISGYPVSSRMTDGKLLVVTDFRVIQPDFASENEYLPQVGTLDDMKSLPMSEIIVPENSDKAEYSVLAYFDEELTLTDSLALFSFSDTLYVSNEHIFVTRDVGKNIIVDGEEQSYTLSMDCTEVACIEKDDLDVAGTFIADGTINDQYSLDEYENKLRMFTTSKAMFIDYSGSGDPDFSLTYNKCNFYCFDLDSMELVASVQDFGEEDESVKSVRFEKSKAYVCTAAESYDYEYETHYLIDPVFEFDLSDLENITVKDTGTMPGYSLSLIRFNDYMLGIGYGEDYDVLKIELYEAQDDKVASVAKYEYFHCDFSKDFKAYFIDPAHSLIGLGVTCFDNGATNENKFLLLRFDGKKFVKIGLYDIYDSFNVDSLDRLRACYDDERVLMLCDFSTLIVPLDNLAQSPDSLVER